MAGWLLILVGFLFYLGAYLFIDFHVETRRSPTCIALLMIPGTVCVTAGAVLKWMS